MRTREEQIASLADTLAWPNHPDDGYMRDAEDIILEAERRAEQRVLAEIARDRERLDWVCNMISRYQIRELVRLMPYGGGLDSWREAIDAAREAE